MLLICCVHYYNTAEVQYFIDHVTQLQLPSGSRGCVVVTDNSQSINRSLISSSDDFTIEVVTPSSNLGYLNGCALGWERICSQGAPGWTLITNTDVRMDLEQFAAVLNREWRPDVGSIAPHVVTAQGFVQNPFYRVRPSKKRIRWLRWLFEYPSLAAGYKWLRRRHLLWRKEFRPPEQAGRIYAPHCSTVLLREAFFKNGGCLEYGGFIYCEELHLAEQLRRAGLKVIWLPSWRVRHFENQTTRQVGWRRRCQWHTNSLKYIEKTYYNL